LKLLASQDCGHSLGTSFISFSIIVILLLVVAVVGVMATKNKKSDESSLDLNSSVEQSVPSGSDTNTSVAVISLPKLLDLGADKCIPCKMMTPILDEIEKTYAGQLNVEFIDVWKDPSAGEKYSIRSIPTQIFYAADGKELFRHEGFFPKEDILEKWKELGVDLSK
jgi:thioredoxin 1